MLSLLSPAISSGEQAFLSDLPTYREFLEVLFSAPRGKSPGIDGFGYEALRELWSDAVLTVQYKLLAKVLAARLALLLPKIVPLQQQGFIQGRNVHGCILNLLLAHESLKMRGKQCAFLMLDLEKAYDRLSLNFLWGVLDKLNFGDKFITVLKGLSSGAAARVQVNSTLTSEFPIHRGVRQGCPLAPLLFAVSTVPFILAAQKGAKNGTFAAVKLPGGLTLDVSALADDTAAFLQVLGRYKATRYLGIMVASSLKPQDAWAHAIATIRRSKVPLVAWDYISAPLRDGGLGIWNLSNFNYAFLVKYVSSLLVKPSDALWPDVFWSLCRDNIRRSRQQFLLFGPPARMVDPPFFSKMLDTWCSFREELCWAPKVISIPASLSLGFALSLIFNAGVISQDERDFVASSLPDDAIWEDLFSFQSEFHGSQQSLWPKLCSLHVQQGSFVFSPQEWKLNGHHGIAAFPLLVGKAYTGLVSAHSLDRFAALNSKWALFWSMSDWTQLFKVIWGKAIQRRDGLFLWKVLFMAFFTGSKAHVVGRFSDRCLKCGGAPEDVAHLFLCPARRRFWEGLFSTCRFLQVVRSDFFGFRIPVVLRAFSLFRPPDRLAALTIFSHALRLCWRRRCNIHFEGSGRVLTHVSPLISFAESLLAEVIFSFGASKPLYKGALLRIFSCSFEILGRFLHSFA
ncbi:hypothetical protein R1sor_004095 [Riccia sorocarpa]|uniref:Reverse transcriptase domain-containing protein n=1 Tax=Riccia sorocarpa TaxID=122646 RepID=A0ABD3H3I3_9MARC